MPITYYITLSFILFSLGMVGILIRRNAIVVLMCIELMLNSVNLLLIAFSKVYATTSGVDTQLFVFFTMIVAAAEAAIGLAIIVRLYRTTGTIDISFLNKLKH